MGRWEVQRERARLEDRFPPPAAREPESIGHLLPDLMKKLGLEDRHWVGVLQEEWPNLVGGAVARHTRPGRVENGRLVVFVDSSVWMHELKRYGREKMLANLQQRFGAERIRSLTLQLDPEGGGRLPRNQPPLPSNQ